VALLDELRRIGVSDENFALERDGWILLVAVTPELAVEWAGQKLDVLADPEFRRLHLAYDEARDWAPDDPRLEQLAAQVTECAGTRGDSGAADAFGEVDGPAISLVEQLMTAMLTRSPSWRRTAELSRSGSGTAGDPTP
jgi:hypothetical protein